MRTVSQPPRPVHETAAHPRLTPLQFPTEATASPAPPPTESALTALRLATHERHTRIDRLMDLRRMRERSHYGRVLQAFHSFLGPWEAGIANALPAHRHGWLRGRSRRHFLREDLAALALAPLDGPGATVTRSAGSAGAWGSLYVIEGSALGGQVITRALAPAGLVPGRGASYFHGWGADTPRMWQEFRAELRAELAAPASVEAACDAACATFDALTAHLHETLNERPALA